MSILRKIKTWWDEKCPVIAAEVEYGPVSYDGIGGILWYEEVSAQARAFQRRRRPQRPSEKAPGLFETFGNGKINRGGIIAAQIAIRLKEARKKHPVFAESRRAALRVIEAEMQELVTAVWSESQERQIDEALDIIATAIRFINREFYEKKDVG